MHNLPIVGPTRYRPTATGELINSVPPSPSWWVGAPAESFELRARLALNVDFVPTPLEQNDRKSAIDTQWNDLLSDPPWPRYYKCCTRPV